MMLIAQLDCFAGVSECTLLGAWLDAGVEEEQWRNTLSGIQLDGCEIQIGRGLQHGLQSTQITVQTGSNEPDKSITDLIKMIKESELPREIQRVALYAYQCLADAERMIHGNNDEFEFELKASIESLFFIVSVAAAWYHVGMPKCYVSEIVVGQGMTDTKYGVMPIPTPVTAQLLTGFVTRSGGVIGELVSTVGAAILRSLCSFERVPLFVPKHIGYGSGKRDLGIPDLLRIQIGKQVTLGFQNNSKSSGHYMVETNIDDMNPEISAYLISRLLKLGASDAYIIPIIMKKGRPGIQLCVLCQGDVLESIKKDIFRQTSSLGLRYYEVQKDALARNFQKAETEYGKITVKYSFIDGEVLNVAPEYEECRLIADQLGVPLKLVYQAALNATAYLYKK